MTVSGKKIKTSMIDGLMFELTAEILRLRSQEGSLEAAGKAAVLSNAPSKRTENSRKRYVTEALSRLRRLTEQETDSFATLSLEDQRLLLWIALCRTYPIVRRFATELLRDSLLVSKKPVSDGDYNAFFSRLAAEEPVYDQLSVPYRQKIKHTIFGAARNAGLLKEDRTVIPAVPSGELCQAVAGSSPEDLLCLPCDESYIRRMLQS